MIDVAALQLQLINLSAFYQHSSQEEVMVRNFADSEVIAAKDAPELVAR